MQKVTRRRLVLGLFASPFVLPMLSVSRATAQGAIPDGVFVTDTTGKVWLVLGRQRINVPIWPASDADIGMLPVSDQWAIMNDVGAIVAGARPSWSTDPASTAITGGPGVSNSAPFRLDGGNYVVGWATDLPSDRLTFIELRSADEDIALRMQVILNASAGNSGSAGETNLFNVKPGNYYLSVRAPSAWRVMISRRA